MDFGEVRKHNTSESCWVILYDQVYDVTEFLPNHPGGSKIVLQLAGQDATDEYDPVHPPGTIEDNLASISKLGTIDKSTLPAVEKAPISMPPSTNSNSDPNGEQSSSPPPVSSLLNLTEIEEAAIAQIPHKARAYYSSGSDDLHSKHHNNIAFRQVLLRPRIFRDVTRCSTRTSLLSSHATTTRVDVPFFVSPAAMARLAHPDGEAGIARACRKFGAAQVISNNASMTPEQIVEDALEDQVFGWQLYVQTDRKRSEDMLARINKMPQFKFVVLTLDAPVPGKREEDERAKNVGANLPVKSAAQTGQESSVSKGKQDEGIGKSLFAGTAPDLTWNTTLSWLVSHTTLPIILKGIQTHEDAYIASRFSSTYPQLRGIILSNHGGRALDTAPPALHTLLEIRQHCPSVLYSIDVWLDGGIKRGTDVVKALCLGARGVGLGRAPLFGLGAGGPEGVERVFEILKEECETAMRLLGVERVEQLGMEHVNTRLLEGDIYDSPSSHVEEGELLLQSEWSSKAARDTLKSKL